MPRKTANRPVPAMTDAGGARATERETGTVRRVLLLLKDLVDQRQGSANAVARRLNLPRSTAHRLLAALRADGFADVRPDGTFMAGPELQRLAGRLRASTPLERLAQPLLEDLSAQFSETSILAILDRRQLRMYYASTASPPDPMRYNIELNRLEPLVWGATGRAILAFLDESEVRASLERREKGPVDGRVLSRAELARSLAEVRAKGYAISRSHRTKGAVGIAAPIFDARGEVIGDFAFLVPEFRFRASKVKALAGALAAAATSLSRQLGANEEQK